MIAAALTDIAGSSDVVERGFVTYSNEAKTELLGVPRGADRASTARSASRSRAPWPRARSRAAAPTSPSPSPASPARAARTAAKPVGLVHFACARRGGADAHQRARVSPATAPRCAARQRSAPSNSCSVPRDAELSAPRTGRGRAGRRARRPPPRSAAAARPCRRACCCACRRTPPAPSTTSSIDTSAGRAHLQRAELRQRLMTRAGLTVAMATTCSSEKPMLRNLLITQVR